MRLCLIVCLAFCDLTSARADGPRDNLPDKVRRIPQAGIEVPAERAELLRKQLQEFDEQIAQLDGSGMADLLPDVRIYAKAVRDALEFNEFFDAKELDVADELLREGQERARQLAEGQAPWATATGLVVRGYVSRIDGSVQPYGLVVPDSYQAGGQVRHRLDIWFHGRGEVLS